MATTKKRRTTGAARGRKAAPKRKRKARVSGTAAPATLTIKGAGRYKKVSCGHTKAEAASRVKKIGATGHKARARKNPMGGYCVYKGGRKKAA